MKKVLVLLLALCMLLCSAVAEEAEEDVWVYVTIAAGDLVMAQHGGMAFEQFGHIHVERERAVVDEREGKILLTFMDDGTPYNPLSHEDPDTAMPAEKRPIGGLGIMLVKKMASAVSYHRTNNRNFFVVERECRSRTV